ncbi:Facilitated trehalose transporter Tret1 [Gryllus bimaculatus]|nr:Facilitated trehalose transporter Tret1 [Gryllus bimaculatus]
MVAVTAPGDPDPKETPPRWPQFLAAALAITGSVLGWSSPSLPVMQRQQLQLVRDNTSVNVTLLPAILTEDQASWAGSLVPLGALLGSVPAGFLADALGRKPVMLGIGAHFLFGWLLILAATLRRGVWLLFCGRALQGACCGAITVVAPLYLEEIAEAQVRGCTGVLFDLATNAGVLSAYVLGAVLAPPALAGSLAALPALFLLAFAWMPESPVHLAARGRDARARRSLTWLRAVLKLVMKRSCDDEMMMMMIR